MIGTALNIVAKALLWVLLLGAAGYVAYDRLVPCKAPVAYSVGAYDIRFGISKAELLSAAKEAAAVWNTAAGKELFVYRSGRGMPINLVYDSRQATTQKTNQLKEDIDQGAESASSIKAQYDAAQARYNEARSAYMAARASASTQADYRTLEDQRLRVNALAGQVNSLGARYNALAQDINARVDTVNQNARGEFEEGQYIRDAFSQKIDIFEYSSRRELVRVLAHELGHSLGLDHNSNKNSIMYASNTSENMDPTVEDLADLRSACRL